MKRCSTCNRTYSDPNLSYCIDDGTPLTEVDPHDESTVVSPRKTETSSNWNDVPYRPPAPYVPPGTQGRQRRVWPWVLGIGGAFILGILAVSIAAVILVPEWMRSAQQEQTTSNTESPNINQAENSNSVEPANSNSNANVSIDIPPPTDRDLVLAQLKNLEHDWTVANINDDKEALQRILADDWVAQLPDGGLQSKSDYIRTNRRDTRIEKWDFDDLKLNLIGDRATLSGKVTFDLQDAGDSKFDFIDKFVWRDGRWQATGSELKPRD